MHQDSDGEQRELGVNEQFGKMMREWRESEGWSQRRLAEALEKAGLKLDPSAVTRIETGQREARLREAVAISDLMGIELDSLSYSDTAAFLRHQFTIAAKMREARTALLGAIRAVDRAVNSLSDESEKELVRSNGFESLPDLFMGMIADVTRTATHGDPGAGDQFAVTYDEDDARVKRAIVHAVIHGLLLTEDEADARSTS